MEAMNKKACLFALTLLASITSGGTLFVHAEAAGTEKRVITTPLTQKTAQPTQEEMVVRAAYDKLTKLNRAAQSSRMRLGAPLDENSVLKFELSGFRVGPIREIALTRAEEL